MAHFLIVDDESEARDVFKNLLKSQSHTFIEVSDLEEAGEAIDASETNTGEPFDLILLDHQLADQKGIQLPEIINNQQYCDHRIVVITASHEYSIAKEYGKIGSLGHLIKPVSEIQFWTTIELALERRAIFVEQKQDWEEAYQILVNCGILDSLEVEKAEVVKIQQQYDILKATYQELLENLNKAGQKEQEIGEAYSKATRSINQIEGTVYSIINYLQPFQYTKAFWDDVEELFRKNRLYFFILQSYLQRIGINPKKAFSKPLNIPGNNHYEYRVSRSYRLYYRQEKDLTILERFGNKNIQSQIITYLSNRNDPIFTAT